MLDDQCRRHVTVTAREAVAAPPGSTADHADGAVASLAASSPPLAPRAAGLPRTFALLSGAGTDAQLAARLMAMPACERQAAALDDPRFRRRSLWQLLVLRAESELFDFAADARPTAELAAAIASVLPRDAAGTAWRSAALAYWLFGKALLKARQWRLADDAFRTVFACVPKAGATEETALAAVGQAQVAADTGAVDAAIAQFLLAAHGFSRVGAVQAVAACQAELGLVLLESGDLTTARLPLATAVRLLDAGAAPSLAARLRLGLAEIAAVLDGPAAAGEELGRARALYELAPDGPAGPEALERRWREARIAAAVGDAAGAAARFDEVRRQLLRRGSAAEAARCTFERLLLSIDARSFADVAGLTGALARAFPGAGERWAREMEALAALATGDPDAVYAPCWDLRRRLRQVAPLEPARPPLLRPARLLSDRLLRRRGELEDPIGDGQGGAPSPWGAP
jgi:hypothetical protein